MNRVGRAALGVGVVAATAVASGVTTSQCITSPPASVPTDCSTDATAGLNSEIAQLPAGTPSAPTILNLASGGCYLVSNSTDSLLVIEGKTDLTINGNGATIKQTSYVGGNAQQPVVTFGGNTDLSVNDLSIVGPSATGGANSEGDIGTLMWQDTNLTLSGVNISNVEGDGIDLYAKGGNQPGVSNNVVVNKSSTISADYHAIVPEYVNGLTVANSTVSRGNIDAEVDFSCESSGGADCGTVTNPNVGIVNMTIENDSFPSGLQLLDGASCMPVGNWSVLNNDFGTGGFNLQMNTTYSLTLSALNACGLYSGLTVSGNKSTATSLRPCCGSGSPYVLIQGWKNVTIAANSFVVPTPGALIELWSTSGVTLKGNTFSGAAGLWDSSPAAGWPPMTGLSTCGNTWASGMKDAPC